MMVRNGVDVLLEAPEKYLEKSHVGLVTNPTGVTVNLESTLDAFYRHQQVKLEAVFGPEHGARGDEQDTMSVPSHIDEHTGLPVHSLYGDHLKPTPDMLDGLDALVFDIQDCGSRFYTYISTLTHCMEACRKEGLMMHVLDRPNPINGNKVEGNILEEGFKSFIGLHSVPIRHGFTVGEIAQHINKGIGCRLDVVRMRAWQRLMWFDDTGLPWVQPSPNLPHLDSATVYPGTCLFEGVNISEGRGTTKPFELIGAPWVNGKAWAEKLNALGLPGVRFRDCYFTPTFWRYREKRCSGVQVHVLDREEYESVETGLHMISTAIDLFPEFKFNDPSYEERRHFDLLAGTDATRKRLENNDPVESILESWRNPLERFQREREKHLLYGEGKSE